MKLIRNVPVKQNNDLKYLTIIRDILIRNLPFCSIFMAIILITDVYNLKLSHIEPISTDKLNISKIIFICLFICFTTVNYNLTYKIKNGWLQFGCNWNRCFMYCHLCFFCVNNFCEFLA